MCGTSNTLCQRINSDTIIVDVIKDIIQSKLFKSSRWEDLQPHEVVVRHKMKIIAHDETIDGIDGITFNDPLVLSPEDNCKY